MQVKRKSAFRMRKYESTMELSSSPRLTKSRLPVITFRRHSVMHGRLENAWNKKYHIKDLILRELTNTVILLVFHLIIILNACQSHFNICYSPQPLLLHGISLHSRLSTNRIFDLVQRYYTTIENIIIHNTIQYYSCLDSKHHNTIIDN